MQRMYMYIFFYFLIMFISIDARLCESHQFIPRSITTDLVYTDLLNYYQRHRKKDEISYIYSGNFINQKSNTSSILGSAFLLRNGCNCVSVNQNGPTDINSNWLGLANLDPDNPFSARFCISPERRSFAYYSYLYFSLDNILEGMWIDIATSLVNVQQHLNCCEAGNLATVCPGIQTVSDALQNPLYRFGIFDCRDVCDALNRWGVDDIQMRIGYERCFSHERNIWGGYLIGTIPTGRKVSALHVFEPLIGSSQFLSSVNVSRRYL